MPTENQPRASATDRFCRETFNIIKARLCTPEVQIRGLEEEIVQDVLVAFLNSPEAFQIALSAANAMNARDEGQPLDVRHDHDRVIGIFYFYVIYFGLNSRKRWLNQARRNESVEDIDDQAEDSRRGFEDDLDLRDHVQVILNCFHEKQYHGVSGYEILMRRFWHNESVAAIAESLGVSSNNLSCWLQRAFNELRQCPL